MLRPGRSLTVLAVVVVAALTAGAWLAAEEPAAKPDAPARSTLPGVWELTKVTDNKGEGEILIFENDEGAFPLSGRGRDPMNKLNLGYEWYVPLRITPGKPFEATISAVAQGADEGGRTDRMSFEAYLSVCKSTHQVQPGAKTARPQALGGFGYKLPFSGSLRDTWTPGDKYGQQEPIFQVGVVYDYDEGVRWYTYYYTFIGLEGTPGDEQPTESVNDQHDDSVVLRLTYPAGRSPKVFTSGWIFGATCTAKEGEDGEMVDLSDKVQWSGTGKFSPATGTRSRPVFAAAGVNTIVLTVKVGEKTITKTSHVFALSPASYACVGGKAKCDADVHGCPACPHTVIGPITTGSPLVLVGGQPAARVGDKGTHAACCGSQTFEITSGDDQVLIDGRPAAKLGTSLTKHCGGDGKLITTGH